VTTSFVVGNPDYMFTNFLICLCLISVPKDNHLTLSDAKFVFMKITSLVIRIMNDQFFIVISWLNMFKIVINYMSHYIN